ncbi:MAG: type IV pilus modification PilV family protein [Planctomycetota bacterium]
MAVKNRFAGFTFTEVITASLLLAVAIVPILKGLSITHFHNKVIKYKTRSLTLAQSQLDRIKVRSIYHYTDSFSQSDLSLDGLYLCNVADTTTEANLRKIVVSVGYDLNKNSQLADDEILVTLSTYIARRW